MALNRAQGCVEIRKKVTQKIIDHRARGVSWSRSAASLTPSDHGENLGVEHTIVAPFLEHRIARRHPDSPG
jgi:hypothetical protein